MSVIELHKRKASFAPASFDAEARTVEAVVSTGANVWRMDARGKYIEALDTAAINLDELAGLPVLDGHRQSGSEHVVGSVISGRHEGASIVCLLRLSAADDVRSVVLKVQEGVLRGVSVGYAVERWTETIDPKSQIRVRTAAAWKIREVSLVSIPADEACQVRSHEMAIETTAAETVATPPGNLARAEVNATIRSIAEVAGLTRAWADEQIDAEADVDAARAAAFVAMQSRSTVAIRTATVGFSNDAPTVVVQRQAEALAQSMGGPAASDAARQYIGLSFTDLARDALARSGVNTSGMSGETILTRAMHTTSDFAGLLDQAGTRVVSNAYQLAESPLKQLVRKRTVTDLRPVTVLTVGEMSALQPVNEAGEIKSVTHGEAGEGYAVETYAGIFNISRKLLINDQHGVFGESAARLGRAAARTEGDALARLLKANPVMSDGNALFSGAHGNTPATPADVQTGFTAAREALRRMTDRDGTSPVSVTPKFLVVSPDLEVEAEKLLMEGHDATVTMKTVLSQIVLLVEPRLDDGSWFVFGDPASAPVLEIANLASAPSPQLSSREEWDQLARSYRVVYDLGVGAIDWRGAYWGG